MWAEGDVGGDEEEEIEERGLEVRDGRVVEEVVEDLRRKGKVKVGRR